MDRADDDRKSSRRLLALVKVPENLTEMTDAELDAWIDQSFPAIEAKLREKGVIVDDPKPEKPC
jgi:hypothetical protein